MAIIVGVLRTKRLFSGTANGFFYGIFFGKRGSRAILSIPYRQELMMHSVLFLFIVAGGAQVEFGDDTSYANDSLMNSVN